MTAHFKSCNPSCSKIVIGMQQHTGFGLQGCFMIITARGAPTSQALGTRRRGLGPARPPVQGDAVFAAAAAPLAGAVCGYGGEGDGSSDGDDGPGRHSRRRQRRDVAGDGDGDGDGDGGDDTTATETPRAAIMRARCYACQVLSVQHGRASLSWKEY
jgi:hypothetical protein